MKVLLVSAGGDGAWFAWLFGHLGHDIDYLISDDKCYAMLEGIAPAPVESVSSPSDYDLTVFDMTGFAEVADQARELTPTIGDSSLADKLEHDRIFGIDFMEKCGIKVPPWEGFDSADRAIAFIREKKKRFVFKPCGMGASCAETYVSKSPEDMEKYLGLLIRKGKVKEFILQEFVSGTEVSTEAWINESGAYFQNHTLEEKKFLAGGLGPNVGCAGSVVWATSRPSSLYEHGLAKAVDPLRGERYVGPIDLNTIVTDGSVYGLEWTPRFGYEATCNLTRLVPMDFAEFLCRCAVGEPLNVGEPRSRFSATIRLSIPPYPLDVKSLKPYQTGVPIEGINVKDLDTFYVSDVRLVPDSEGALETAGTSGIIGTPIGCGETLPQAFEEVTQAIKRLRVPDLQWRVDVPQTTAKRYETLERQGWLRSTS